MSVVIITGASKGIGKAATLEALTKFDCKVVAVARSSTLLDELYNYVDKELGKANQLQLVVGDVTDEKVIQRAVNAAVDKWGRLDSVIANAG
ncbi:MAG: SDR family NAD(P)-dependent oxidoreductase [Paenibacillus sp.]|nr:SDR family NAD(P)-dependent oxidoreductase [Paenibacillus sp.]